MKNVFTKLVLLSVCSNTTRRLFLTSLPGWVKEVTIKQPLTQHEPINACNRNHINLSLSSVSFTSSPFRFFPALDWTARSLVQCVATPAGRGIPISLQNFQDFLPSTYSVVDYDWIFMGEGDEPGCNEFVPLSLLLLFFSFPQTVLHKTNRHLWNCGGDTYDHKYIPAASLTPCEGYSWRVNVTVQNSEVGDKGIGRDEKMNPRDFFVCLFCFFFFCSDSDFFFSWMVSRVDLTLL